MRSRETTEARESISFLIREAISIGCNSDLKVLLKARLIVRSKPFSNESKNPKICPFVLLVKFNGAKVI
jgi:hypothetical protein